MAQYRKNTRAHFLVYNEGDYFITICLKDRRPLFGKIRDGVMYLSEIGRFASIQLESARSINPNVDVLLFVVMPNHIHAIVRILNSGDEDMPPLQRSPNPSLREFSDERRSVPALSRYVNSFKGAVTRYARSLGADFQWHNRYYDHCIRGTHDGNRISEYIMANVENWKNDSFNV